MDVSGKNDFSPLSMLLGICKAQLVVLGTGLLLLLLFCWIAISLDDPDAVTMPLSLTALCISALAGGIGAVRFTGDGMLSGLCSGVLTMLLVRAMSLLSLPDAAMETGTMVIFYCLIPALSVCGAVIGKKRRKTTRHRVDRKR